LVGDHDPGFLIQFSEAIETGAAAMLGAACGMVLEGIVSKKADGRYRSGCQTSWLKTKCYAEESLTVIGTEHEPGSAAFALLARETDGGLAYAPSCMARQGRGGRRGGQESHRASPTAAGRQLPGLSTMW